MFLGPRTMATLVAASHSCGALGQEQQKTNIILNGYFLCLSCPSATCALQHGGFVPRGLRAAKGLLTPGQKR